MTKLITTLAKNTVEASTITVPFELKLPAEFNIKPDHVVPLSKFLEAHIYANTPSPHHRVDAERPAILGYRTVLIDTRTGARPVRFRHEDTFYVTPLDVQLHLREIAKEAAPKVKRTVERDEEF